MFADVYNIRSVRLAETTKIKLDLPGLTVKDGSRNMQDPTYDERTDKTQRKLHKLRQIEERANSCCTGVVVIDQELRALHRGSITTAGGDKSSNDDHTGNSAAQHSERPVKLVLPSRRPRASHTTGKTSRLPGAHTSPKEPLLPVWERLSGGATASHGARDQLAASSVPIEKTTVPLRTFSPTLMGAPRQLTGVQPRRPSSRQTWLQEKQAGRLPASLVKHQDAALIASMTAAANSPPLSPLPSPSPLPGSPISASGRLPVPPPFDALDRSQRQDLIASWAAAEDGTPFSYSLQQQRHSAGQASSFAHGSLRRYSADRQQQDQQQPSWQADGRARVVPSALPPNVAEMYLQQQHNWSSRR